MYGEFSYICYVDGHIMQFVSEEECDEFLDEKDREEVAS